VHYVDAGLSLPLSLSAPAVTLPGSLQLSCRPRRRQLDDLDGTTQWRALSLSLSGSQSFSHLLPRSHGLTLTSIWLFSAGRNELLMAATSIDQPSCSSCCDSRGPEGGGTKLKLLNSTFWFWLYFLFACSVYLIWWFLVGSFEKYECDYVMRAWSLEFGIAFCDLLFGCFLKSQSSAVHLLWCLVCCELVIFNANSNSLL